ncbi:hypothetical protein C9374_011799 [Naegleria lovaniensis]|uniref:Uncharacterized protein n=1 Tax=Naegleria lovaniensis TaxID=51637 RepID=A0AA88G8V4_NAELO|nr:uncharacterized protein C9374_011799 [Naegleria lovaniensis]KAG2373710.1 hypothetical protein C9374_011799 [Naegleria lovaniensis]
MSVKTAGLACVLCVVVALLLFSSPSALALQTIQCKTVKKDNFYQNGIPFYGFKSKQTISAFIMMKPIMANYLFAPDNSQGVYCTQSWNKLYGATRCGYLDTVHEDSDRFVWRRPITCVKTDAQGHVLGNVDHCPLANKVQVAAYAYDNGQEPFQHQGTLLKEFTTLVDTDVWYEYELIFEQDKTTYNLYSTNVSNSSGSSSKLKKLLNSFKRGKASVSASNVTRGQLLESKQIIHGKQCSNYTKGMYLDLYFGGRCPAPADIHCCYIYN